MPELAVCPRLSAKARLRTDTLSGQQLVLYPEGLLWLNATGAAVLELCDGRRTLEEITRVLAGRYDVPATRLVKEVASFLRRLQEQGLVHLQAGGRDHELIPG